MMATDERNLTREQAESTRDHLAEIWAANDANEDYEDQNALEYLNEMPLGVVFERGEPFAVVLGTGGPHVEITGGGRSGGYTLEVYWAGDGYTLRGEAITRTGDYFREMWDELS